MDGPCTKIRYTKKRSSKPIIKVNKRPKTSDRKSGTGEPPPFQVYGGEGGEYEEDLSSFVSHRNNIGDLRNWVDRQRFIPHDLSDEFLTVFLSGSGFDLDAATQKLHDYFYSRQEPSPLFRDRDPLSPDNVRLFENSYVVPMPDTTEYGGKIILMGARKQAAVYSPMQHAKALAMVIDLLIWKKDFGFGEFVVVLDGRGFECPQLLEKKVTNHRAITSLLLDTIPGSLRSFYLLYPPSHVANVAESRNGIWLTVVKSKKEMTSYLPADILPLEFGGNLGHLEDILVQWQENLISNRDFFVHFESKMIHDYRRRIFHEREVERGGKAWVYRMKLEQDEWQYKVEYYEKMKNMVPEEHPGPEMLARRKGFGQDRIDKQKNEKPIKYRSDYLDECKRRMREQGDADLLFEPTYLYHGYAPEIRKAQRERERQEREEEEEKKKKGMTNPNEKNQVSCFLEFENFPDC